MIEIILPNDGQIDGVTSEKITPFKPNFKGTEGPLTWSISQNLPELSQKLARLSQT